MSPIMMRSLSLLTWVLVRSTGVDANGPAEELPPPSAAAAHEAGAESATIPSRDVPSAGWSLKGELGQHIFINDVAVADYTWEGRRHIVLLDQDRLPQQGPSDPYYLYFHERETGNRWAIGRYPSAAQDYAVYFQSFDGPKVWTRFQRARLSRNEDRSVIAVGPIVIESPSVELFQAEPMCGH